VNNGHEALHVADVLAREVMHNEKMRRENEFFDRNGRA